MVLMGGPIDPRVNPTAVNRFATAHSLDWFERTVITTVPARYPGAFRRVYPGFLQLAGFLSMNLDRHVDGALDGCSASWCDGDGESAAATRAFYDEYSTVMDLPADFYLQTDRARVPAATTCRMAGFGCAASWSSPAAIERTALMTVEGERDDICAVGQTAAAHASAAPASRRRKRRTTCSSKSAITASSTAAAGRARPIPRSGPSSGRRAEPGRLAATAGAEEESHGAYAGKVVITCAVTGSIHTPTMSPYLPLTPDEIARDAIAAAEAGAAILHLHARDPKDGRPTPDPDVFMQFLPRIKQATERRRQHHHRRRPRHDPRRAARRAAARQARDVLAEHGLDEFRALPDARPLQGVEIRVGAAGISK